MSAITKGGFEMRRKGLQNSVRTLIVLALAGISCQPVCAQQAFYLPLEGSGNGQPPLSFMRPHYFIHEAAGASLTTPPSTAFQPAQIRHAYGFDLLSNQGSGQIIAIVDAYDEEEQAGGFFTMIEEHLALPFPVKVLGVDADVEKVDMTLDGQIVAICRRGKTRQKIPILDLPLPTPAPAGVEWIVAYRHWRRGTW